MFFWAILLSFLLFNFHEDEQTWGIFLFFLIFISQSKLHVMSLSVDCQCTACNFVWWRLCVASLLKYWWAHYLLMFRFCPCQMRWLQSRWAPNHLCQWYVLLCLLSHLKELSMSQPPYPFLTWLKTETKWLQQYTWWLELKVFIHNSKPHYQHYTKALDRRIWNHAAFMCPSVRPSVCG